MATRVDHGRRPAVGWRVAIVFLATCTIWAVSVYISWTVFDLAFTPLSRLTNALIVFTLSLVLVFIARRYLDRRPVRTLGLQGWPQAGKHLLIGAVSFLLPSLVGLTVSLLAGWVSVTVLASPLDLIAGILFTIATVLVLEALPEELIFRGYIYRNLAASMAPIAAVAIQTALFALFGTALWVVTAGWGVLVERSLLFLCMGFVLGLLRVISGSVWNPIGFHLAFQVVAQTMLGADIQADNPGVLTTAGIVTAFVFATSITLFFTRRQPDWKTPDPDPRDLPAT